MRVAGPGFAHPGAGLSSQIEVRSPLFGIESSAIPPEDRAKPVTDRLGRAGVKSPREAFPALAVLKIETPSQARVSSGSGPIPPEAGAPNRPARWRTIT